jgi:mono/diheme cytochrome c family protein
MGRQAGRGPALMDTKRTDIFLATRIMNGKAGSMPAFGGNLDDQQLNDLIAFIHSIKPEGTQ